MYFINWKSFLLPYAQLVDELLLKLLSVKKEYELAELHSPIETVYGRVKSISSILDKANRKGISLNEIEEKIEDIAGIRVICRFVEDIDKVLDILRARADYDLQILEERDYIANMKPSGYRSYHVLLKYTLFHGGCLLKKSCEIQIRTMAMDFWATIEHSLNYKYNGDMPEELRRRLFSSADAAFQLDKEMGTIREEIMEAQKIIQVKSLLVDEIMQNLQKLYQSSNLEKANELNIEFMALYEEDNLDKLHRFNARLKTIAQLYNIN